MKILLSILAFLAISIGAFAYDIEVDGIYYNYINYYEVEVTRINWNEGDYSGDVVIPESIYVEGNEYSVRSIAEGAFANCPELTSVSIPVTIDSDRMGAALFEGCDNLEKIYIWTENFSRAFWGLNSDVLIYATSNFWYDLYRVYPQFDGVNIRDYNLIKKGELFYYLDTESLTAEVSSETGRCWYEHGQSEVEIPATITFGGEEYDVTSIGANAFYGYRSLGRIFIPESVTTIGVGAFSSCTNLSEITIPKSVTSIGASAFNFCTMLRSVTFLSSTPPEMGDNVFGDIWDATLYVPAGSHAVYANEDWTNSFDNIVEDVASVTIGKTTTGYADIQDALTAAKAASSATLTLLQDINRGENSMDFYSGSNVTLDLNGYTITGNYTTVLYLDGASLTITDSSAGKTGKMVNSLGVINAYSGVLTIQGGTFTSNNARPLYCSLSEFSSEPLVVSIEGGRFITESQSSSAIYSDFGTNILAYGYGFYDTDNDARLTNFVNKELMDENGNPAKDVTVKPLVIDVLDLADATTYDEMNAGCKVTDFTYTRDFGGTNWTTWYVPFDLVLTDEICQKLAFSRINNVHQYDDDDNGVPDRTVIESFRQKAGVTLRANYPYLVKALNDADRNIELRLSNVTLAPAAENSIDCQSVDYIYTFTGTYAGMGDSGLNSNSPYSLNDTYWDNNWYHFRSLEPQRHYMVIEPTNGAQAPRNIKVRLNVAGEEDATGIVTLYSDKDRMQDEVDVYDLMGRKLNSNSTQRGLRIQNGKVIFNK